MNKSLKNKMINGDFSFLNDSQAINLIGNLNDFSKVIYSILHTGNTWPSRNEDISRSLDILNILKYDFSASTDDKLLNACVTQNLNHIAKKMLEIFPTNLIDDFNRHYSYFLDEDHWYHPMSRAISARREAELSAASIKREFKV